MTDSPLRCGHPTELRCQWAKVSRRIKIPLVEPCDYSRAATCPLACADDAYNKVLPRYHKVLPRPPRAKCKEPVPAATVFRVMKVSALVAQVSGGPMSAFVLLLLATVTSAEYVASFDHGVASGDPRPDSIVLWTRVTPQLSLHQQPACASQPQPRGVLARVGGRWRR